MHVGAAPGLAPEPRPPSQTEPKPPAGSFQSELDRVRADVEVRRTALSGDEARAAIERAWTARFGAPPSRETLGVLVAQWAHETGRGASMYNFNFGGIKGVGPSGLSVVQRTREGSGATERVIHDRFRAYQTAEEGAADYLALLEKRYGAALEGAKSGDPEAFVRGLRARGYFTGDAGAYARSVSKLSELVATRGFDALGGATGVAPARLDAPAGGVARAELSPSFEPPVPEDTPFVSALALADEIGRTAVRILSERSDRDEEADRV